MAINPDGTFSYTPSEGFVGEDSFEYEVCNAAGQCDTAVVTINVLENDGTNRAPVSNSGVGVVNYNRPVTGNLLESMTDPDGDELTVSTTPVIPPSNGTLVINQDGTYSYTPDEDFEGNDSFTYEVCDTSGNCEVATVYLTVFNTPPTTLDDINTGVGDGEITGNVLTNDNDPDRGDELQVTSN